MNSGEIGSGEKWKAEILRLWHAVATKIKEHIGT
jgi:hypothetical protein